MDNHQEVLESENQPKEFQGCSLNVFLFITYLK